MCLNALLKPKKRTKIYKKIFLMLNLIVSYVTVYTEKFGDFERILNVLLIRYKSYYFKIMNYLSIDSVSLLLVIYLDLKIDTINSKKIGK